MARLLLFAATTGYQTRAFGDAADRLGVDLVFATDRCHSIEDPWRDGAVAIRFHEVVSSVDAVVAAAAERPVDGVLAVGDQPVPIAARVAAALGLAWHPPDGALVSVNKRLTRERLAAAGLPTTWQTVVPLETSPEEVLAHLRYPCVVKPLALSGSRGVIRADDPDGFRSASARLHRLLTSVEVRAMRDPANDAMAIEGFVEGREYALEGLMTQGRLQPLALFDKPDPLDGPFFEETIYVTPSRTGVDDQRAITSAVAGAARAIGLRHGPIHAECRVNDRGVFVLEVAARPIGGLCARALRFVPQTGGPDVSLEELLLRTALGESPAGWTRETAAAGVMMVPIPRSGIFKGVEGVAEAMAVPGITDVTITAKPDQRLVPLPEGASYLGFIFARTESPEAVEQALRSAHARLRVRVDARV